MTTCIGDPLYRPYKVNPALKPSLSQLRAAIFTSLENDQACGLSCPNSANQRATDQKRQFTQTFNPFAQQYLGKTYNPDQF